MRRDRGANLSFYQQSQHVVRAAVLPGIVPRVRDMLRAPFALLAGLYADVLAMAGLLPSNHPYRYTENLGRFGLLDVLRQAARHVRFDAQHIDQVFIFFALLAATVSFFVFLGLSLVTLILTPSFAGPMDVSGDLGGLMSSVYNFTQTKNPDHDVALMLLDRTLGIVGNSKTGSFFGSTVPIQCTGGGLNPQNCVIPPFPNSYQAATLSLIEFHSFVVFSFAILYLAYLVVVLVMDSTLTGKPIREKMDPFWTPIRLVVAIGLLVPLAPQGLNSSQYIVLYTAKYSSAFASNSWLYYHAWLDKGMAGQANPTGMPTSEHDNKKDPVIPISSPLGAKLSAPDVGDLVRFFHLVAACEYYYERENPGINVQGYFLAPGKAPIPAYNEWREKKNGLPPEYKADDPSTHPFPPYADALKHFGYGHIRIGFGTYDPVKSPETGGFTSLCGELVIPVSSIKDPETQIAKNPGAAIAHEYYYGYAMGLWDKSTYPRQLMDGFAAQIVENYAPNKNKGGLKSACALDTDGMGSVNDPRTGIDLPELGPCNQVPPASYMQYQIESFQTIFQLLIQAANAELANPKNFKIDQDVLDRGWAGAGVWFQHVANINGAYVSAVQQMPYGKERPKVMEGERDRIMRVLPNIQDPDDFCAKTGGETRPGAAVDKTPAHVLCQVNAYLKSDSNNYTFRFDPNGSQGVSGLNGHIMEGQKQVDNILMRIANTIFGTGFLFQPCDNTDTHPLVYLSTLGRTILETAARQLMTGSAIAAAGGLASVGNEDAASSLKKISNFYVAIASVMFSAGFMLYYVLPMLPFIYFFFAVLSWVKAVYEALLGAPMWALTFLNLQGDGIGTSKSRGGFMLLLEILLRPIITVFSLIAAMSVFTALVMMIHDTLPLVVKSAQECQAATGASGNQFANLVMGQLIDKFFFTILYLLLMYLVAMNCFKIIDLIPNKFVRWIGGGAKSFAGEAYNRDTPSQKFTSNVYVAVANPLHGLIDKTDEQVYEASHAGAVIMNEDGKLAGLVKGIFGEDRKTRATESIKGVIKDMTGQYAAATEAKANLEGDGGRDLSSAEIEGRIKFLKMQAAVNDPDQIMKDILSPGSSGIDKLKLPAELVPIYEANIERLKEEIKKTQPLVWEMIQRQTEEKGGVYATRDMTIKTFQGLVTNTKKSLIAKMEKDGVPPLKSVTAPPPEPKPPTTDGDGGFIG
jgi:conjugal transfer/type IV secretion protein DotA/TraY